MVLSSTSLSLSTSICLVAWQLWHLLVHQIKTWLNKPSPTTPWMLGRGKGKHRDKASTHKEKSTFYNNIECHQSPSLVLSKANHTILDLPKCSLNITVEMPNTTNFDASDKLIQTQCLTGLASMSVLPHLIPCPVLSHSNQELS